MKRECPACGEKTYNYLPTGYDGGQPIDPAEGNCENCGFEYQESFNNPELKQAEWYRSSKYYKPKKGGRVMEKIKTVIVGCGGSAVHYTVVDEKILLRHHWQCHRIEDASSPDEKMHNHIFVGYDKDNNKLFEIINQPVTIEYDRELEIKITEDDDIPF